MSTNNDPWKKLSAAAQRAPGDESSLEVPYGFSTRVVARWKSQTTSTAGLDLVWQRFGFGALAASLVVAAVCLALNYENLQTLRQDDQELAALGATEETL